MFSNKDLMIVFMEDKPNMKIPDLLGMWDWGGECGLALVPQAFKYFQQWH